MQSPAKSIAVDKSPSKPIIEEKPLKKSMASPNIPRIQGQNPAVKP
jgi:hypothetical protein